MIGGPGRLGVLTTSFPRHADDPAGVFVADRVAELLAQGHAVDVVAAGDAALDDARGEEGPTRVTFDEGEARVWRLPSPRLVDGTPLFFGMGAPEVFEARSQRASGVWSAALRFGSALTALATRLGTTRRWSVVESHWLLPCALAARLATPTLPRRAWSHAGDVALLERLRGKGGRSLARWLAREAGELRFVSADLRARFGHLAGGPVGGVHELPLPRALFRPTSADARLHAKTRLAVKGFCVLTVARLVPIKGVDVLLEACRALPTPCELVIIGDGPGRPALEARARSLNLNARFLGQLPRREVATWLAAADAYVQPSRPVGSGRTEGMPTAVREALAVGVKVIASRTGGLSELGDRATLVPPEDPSALAFSLTHALRCASSL